MNPTPAELYRALHRGSPGDLRYYQDACAGAERILELGCGYGRLVEALAESGRRITGLDQDEHLLDLARQIDSNGAEITWLQGDMCSLDIPERFDRILLAFNTFYCLPEERKKALFRRVYRHLRPGGLFVMDAYAVPRSDKVGWESFCPPEAIVGLSLAEGIIDVFEESHEDYDRKTIHVTYSFQQGDRPVGQQTIEHAYWYEDEFQPALKACGFEAVEQSQGFGRERTQVVLTARR